MNISPWTNNAKQRTCIPSFKEIVKIKNTVTISVPNDVPVYCMSFYFANSNVTLSLKMHASFSIGILHVTVTHIHVLVESINIFTVMKSS